MAIRLNQTACRASTARGQLCGYDETVGVCGTKPGGMKTARDKRQNRDTEIQAGSMVDVTCGSFGCGRLAKKMRADTFIPDDCDPEIGSTAACLVGLRI